MPISLVPRFRKKTLTKVPMRLVRTQRRKKKKDPTDEVLTRLIRHEVYGLGKLDQTPNRNPMYRYDSTYLPPPPGGGGGGGGKKG